uniref:Putative hydrogen-transporting atp synthase n=1 Tax=Corethrella appendiculata TaxID=1370023 RepID=U5EU53_9DIPT
MASIASKGQGLVNTLLAQARPKFGVFLKYAKVELTPPTPADIPAIRDGISRIISGARTGAWKNLTVRDAWLNTLVTAEVFFWFYAGECIGKRHLVGYDVLNVFLFCVYNEFHKFNSHFNCNFIKLTKLMYTLSGKLFKHHNRPNDVCRCIRQHKTRKILQLLPMYLTKHHEQSNSSRLQSSLRK